MFVFGNALEVVARLVDVVVRLYVFVLIGSVICSWVNADPFNPIVRIVRRLSDPCLNLIRRFVPPIAGLDFSPLIGILILGVGFAVAQIVFRMLTAALESSVHATLLANGAKYGVITFAFFMAMQQIGFAENIIITAFSALFGAFCLAAALAFGLGARGIAGDFLESRFGNASKTKKKA